jgi:hypothetical protein
MHFLTKANTAASVVPYLEYHIKKFYYGQHQQKSTGNQL